MARLSRYSLAKALLAAGQGARGFTCAREPYSALGPHVARACARAPEGGEVRQTLLRFSRTVRAVVAPTLP